MSNDDVVAPTTTEGQRAPRPPREQRSDPAGGSADDEAAIARASFAAGKPIPRSGAGSPRSTSRRGTSGAAPTRVPTSTSTSTPPASDAIAPPDRLPRPPRQPRAAAEAKASDGGSSAAVEAPASDRAPGDGASTGTSSSAKRRRRRGGRGRGRGGGQGVSGSGGATRAPAGDADLRLVDEEAPVQDSAESQRDDATPDVASGPPAPRRRRSGSAKPPAGPLADPGNEADRVDETDAGNAAGAAAKPATRSRSRRGSGARTEPKPKPDQTGSEPKAPTKRAQPAASGSKRAGTAKKMETAKKTETGRSGAKQPESRSRRGSPSREADVAAGGPTRLRSSRSRTGAGRDAGARPARGRRREQIPIPPRITDKLMVITEHDDRDQIAILEGRDLVQHFVTRSGAKSMVGNVYLGRVQNVLPGMEAAFIDIGRGRNGVLYAGEVNYSPEDLEGPAPRIENVLKSGQAVMVQITKDPMGGKGARLTAQVSMPGRYLVLAPNQEVSGISRRLNEDERKRLKGILKKIRPAEDGVIVRTAAEGAAEEAFAADLQRLVRTWDDIQKKAKKVKAPAELYEEPELTVRVVRDLFVDEEFRGLVTDSQRVHDKVMEYVEDVAPDLKPKVSLHTGKLPAFEEHHVVEQIHKALDRKVWLPSGGYLIIERTEAMTIIDVNTGKSVGKTNLEETVKNTNLEAAQEAARQLRLRDIGGIIVIDFIDMLLEKNKKSVEDAMQEALAADKTRSQVFEIGPLGLMQVTRKRVSGGLVESFSETCPTCEGRGIILNYDA